MAALRPSLFLLLASALYILSVSPFVRLNVLETALLIADRVELLAGPASVSCSRHSQPPVVSCGGDLMQLVLACFYQNVGEVVH